jgi:hypothetical protein
VEWIHLAQDIAQWPALVNAVMNCPGSLWLEYSSVFNVLFASHSVAGRAMAHVISHQPLTAKAWVHAYVSPCGIYGGQSGTGIGFSPSFSVVPCQHYFTVILHFYISSGG